MKEGRGGRGGRARGRESEERVGGTIKISPELWTAPNITKAALTTDVEAGLQANYALFYSYN